MLLLQFFQLLLLIDGFVELRIYQNISDVRTYCKILETLGAKITWFSDNEID